MKTVRDLTDDDMLALSREPQVTIFLMRCGQITLPIRIVRRALPGVGLHAVDRRQCWPAAEGWNDGCGYANISVRGRTHKLHRVLYQILRGPIPPGYVLDHVQRAGEALCPRNCCNPWHLEAVPDAVNIKRGQAPLFKHGENHG